MKYACPKCEGRGWLRPARVGVDWPEVCPLCQGHRVLKVGRLAALLTPGKDDDGSRVNYTRKQIWLAEQSKLGPVRGVRLLDAIARVFPGELEIRGIAKRVALQAGASSAP